MLISARRISQNSSRIAPGASPGRSSLGPLDGDTVTLRGPQSHDTQLKDSQWEHLVPGVALHLAALTGLGAGALGGLLTGGRLGQLIGLPSAGLLAGGLVGGAVGLAVGAKTAAWAFSGWGEN